MIEETLAIQLNMLDNVAGVQASLKEGAEE